MLKELFSTTQERLVAAALLLFWAVLFLPNLRTNPNWYGDEGIVMEEAWTLAQGHPRYGPLQEDFLSPNPHPPIYLMLLGGLLKVFGNDIVVGRALQVATALATVTILFWVGTLLRDKKFGFLCAAAFLCYPEVAIHYRWVRAHPMQGMWVLACIGFLIQYIQEKRLRDVVCAGVMCSLAVGTHYFAFPLMGIVVLTALLVNKRHVWAAVVTSCAFIGLFFFWFLISHDGGISHLMVRFSGASQQGFDVVKSSWLGEIFRLYKLLVEFVFLTPTLNTDGTLGVDIWILTASLGILFFPVAKFRRWLVFWVLGLMVGVFAGRNTVGAFIYQAFGFIPLLAVGFAGALVQLGDRAARILPERGDAVRIFPAVVLLGGLGFFSLLGSLGHFHTKIDRWTVQSWMDAEATMQFVNSRTTSNDYVVMPDQLFWLYAHEKKAQLIHCAHYELGIEENSTVGVPRDQYWFDCRLENAKYVVLAYALDGGGQPFGIDAIFWLGYKGPREIFQKLQKQEWPVVFQRGEYTVVANPKFQSGSANVGQH